MTFIPDDEALYDKDLPDNLFRRLSQIWTLCWNTEKGKVEWLGPTTTLTLAEKMDLHRGTLWRTLDQLAHLGWIEIVHLRNRTFRIKPRSRQRDIVAPSFSLFSMSQELDQEGIDQVIVGATRSRGRDLVQNQPELSTGTSTAEALEILLKGVGVGQPARSRIIATGISIEKAGQHLARKRIAKEPLAYAIKRMLDGLPVPEYCRVCFGIDGQHRWVQDETGPMECPVPRTKHWSAVEIADAFGENFGEITPLR